MMSGILPLSANPAGLKQNYAGPVRFGTSRRDERTVPVAAGGITAVGLTASQIGVDGTIRTLVLSGLVGAGVWLYMKFRR